jgi:outer membrane protein OmpA-like peptidoglycan-associated protein/tetratricopeptide (TPR) repeat protein
MSTGHAQLHTESRKALQYYNQAVESYRFLDYEKAYDAIKKAIVEDPGFIEAQLLLAELSSDQNKYSEAIEAYQAVIDIKPHFYHGAYYNLGHLEMLTGRYEDALVHLNQYLEFKDAKASLKQKVIRDIRTCEFALEAMASPVPFDPKNLGPGVNSPLDEYWPSITADNRTLVITRLDQSARQDAIFERPRKTENFYVSIKTDDIWGPARDLGPPINTPGNEGAQSLSADGFFMYFTACNRQDGLGSCDLYVSSALQGNWSNPKNLNAPVNSSNWEAQPSISPDGNTLYFVSNRPGGYGKMDLWRSTRTGGVWSEPENLGPNINTEGNEMSPHIHKDNQTLYFSSDGWIGLGGFDLFVTRKINDSSWVPPQNLGYPINRWSDEIGMVVSTDGLKAYYSASFDAGQGKDIYMFDLPLPVRPEPVSYIQGTVFDEVTQKPLIAEFELIDLEQKQTAIQAFSNRNGQFLVCLPSDKNYALNVSHPDYLFYSEHFSLEGVKLAADPKLLDVPMKPVRKGEKSILRNIFFEYDSYILLDASVVELNKLVGFLNENAHIVIEIQGHTDSRGTPEYNKILSEKRARAVYDYLLDHGLDPDRISYTGYGEAHPIENNDTDYGRSRNRRIEFVIKEVNHVPPE